MTPVPSTASIAMCERPSSPRTGAPASATDPVSAQASIIGASRGSSAVIAGASSSYPVKESSGKTTTLAPAARIVSACVIAFTETS